MENRLQVIYSAASSLFIDRGYMRTQIKDIADKIGMSAGMLYVYFKGKQEILDFILKCTIDPAFLKRDFIYPIGPELFLGLHEEIIEVLNENQAAFSAPLAHHADNYPFSQMLSDAFDTIARYGTGCLVIEKNINDLGPLGAEYISYRKVFFQSVLRYLELYRSRGELRAAPNLELAAQQVIQTLAWWGMHVQNDAFEPQTDISPAVAKDVCLDNLIHAYQS